MDFKIIDAVDALRAIDQQELDKMKIELNQTLIYFLLEAYRTHKGNGSGKFDYYRDQVQELKKKIQAKEKYIESYNNILEDTGFGKSFIDLINQL